MSVAIAERGPMKLASRPGVGNEQSAESDHYAPLCPWICHLRHLFPRMSNYGRYRIAAFVFPSATYCIFCSM